MGGAHLVVLADRDAIVWVLRERRMAFVERPRGRGAGLTKGDVVFLYATRGAWHNPNRYKGRIFARGVVASGTEALDQPLTIGERTFHSGCRLRIQGVVPHPDGLELAPLAPLLDAFPKSDSWSFYLRRTILQLSDRDAAQISRGLEPLLVPRAKALPGYEASIPP